MRLVLLLISLIALLGCLIAPVLFFNGMIGREAYRNGLAALSLAWFIFATLYATRAPSPRR